MTDAQVINGYKALTTAQAKTISFIGADGEKIPFQTNSPGEGYSGDLDELYDEANSRQANQDHTVYDALNNSTYSMGGRPCGR